MSIKAKHETVETMKIKKAFKGFIISLVTTRDAGGVVPTVAQLIEPDKVIVTLRNNASNMTIFSMSLERIFRMLKKGDRDLASLLYGVTVTERCTPLDVDGYWQMQNLSLEFDTYEGDYDFVVETKQAMPVGSQVGSYVEFEPIFSDKPMLYEVIYNDRSLNQLNFDETLGSGIEELVLMGVGFTNKTLAPGVINEISRAGYSSSESNEMYNTNMLLAHTQLFQEKPTQTNTSEVILHDGEVLGNVNVAIEMTNTNLNWVLLFRKILPNPNAEASIARADNRQQRVFDMVDNNI